MDEVVKFCFGCGINEPNCELTRFGNTVPICNNCVKQFEYKALSKDDSVVKKPESARVGPNKKLAKFCSAVAALGASF